MLMAYDDLGFTIKDIPTDDQRVGLYPIDDLSQAKKILAWAQKERLDVHWIIQRKNGKGLFRIRGSM
jgi:hypothetical protein